MIKLSPCPFCGGAAEVVRIGTRRVSCQVACTMCGSYHESSDEWDDSGRSWNERVLGRCDAALTYEWLEQVGLDDEVAKDASRFRCSLGGT